MNSMIMVDQKPEADGSTVVYVESAKEQLLHIFSLPDHYRHDDCADFDDDCYDDDDDDDAYHRSASCLRW